MFTIIREALFFAKDKLRNISTSPALDAEVLLENVAKKNKEFFYTNPDSKLSESERELYLSFISRREKGEPVAYITGEKEFWGLAIKVNPSVLIPRPETEHIVEEVSKYVELLVRDSKKTLKILDLGTGSGCISAAVCFELLKKDIDFQILATDRSEAALLVAKKNFKKFGYNEKISTLQSDWFENLENYKSYFDIIVTNPPYVPHIWKKKAQKDLSYEPELALYSEDSGFKDVKLILKDISNYMSPDSLFLCEIGDEQSELLKVYVNNFGYKKVEFIKDLAGVERVLSVRN